MPNIDLINVSCKDQVTQLTKIENRSVSEEQNDYMLVASLDNTIDKIKNNRLLYSQITSQGLNRQSTTQNRTDYISFWIQQFKEGLYNIRTKQLKLHDA